MSHGAASALAALLFYGAGHRGRDLRAAVSGASLHALLDGIWIVHLVGGRAGPAPP